MHPSQFDGAAAFSGGGFMPSQATQGPEPSFSYSKNRDARSLLPLTVKQINDAFQSIDDKSNMIIDGVDVNNASHSCWKGLQQSWKNYRCYFRARIECSKWLQEDVDTNEAEGIRDGMYVRLHGHLKGFQGKRTLNVFSFRGRYDVFLSFRGEDTRKAFTSHLHSSLINAGIVVFKDDVNLPRGNNISSELSFGIEHSSISIIILSKDYAGSKWCLNELSNIMELHRAQRQIALPVFYDVNPLEVRHQASDFGDAFENLIRRISAPNDQVMRWRVDLKEAAGIAGFFVPNSRNENEAIQRIVRRVSEILNKKDMCMIAQHPVGVNSRVQDLIRMLENDPANDVRKWETDGFGSKYDRARYDVYLSYRGYDIRTSFAAHLYSSLTNAGIVVFKGDDDDDSLTGLSILPELLRGIERSTISIVIFSRNYADSRWCLNELSIIMDLHNAQGRVVLPVFYGVDPSEVRHQSGSFGEAFEDLKIKASESIVSKLRVDLCQAASLAGFVVDNSRNEVEDIKNIVEHVCSELEKKDLFIAKHPVGVDSRLQDLIKISKSYSKNDVLLLGIWGMGGVGKTTIAKAIYNEIGRTFQSRSFLSNIRAVWEQDNGLVNLQQQLLSEICKTTTMVIRSIESGKAILKECLCYMRALVVLDDMNDGEQLDALCGSREWFGPGSRIIITTRNKRLLRLLEVDHIYETKILNESESLELFGWHAFKLSNPKEGFIDLSRNIVAYSGGLPLALEILGSYLLDRKVTEWESVLDKLKRIPNYDIQKKLKISFDGLGDDMVKEIFLDISCFFIGKDRSDVTQILDGSGLFPQIGISVLVERSLVTVDKKNKLGMHDLLREMGKEIIRERSPKELGKRSRLWFHEDVLDILSKHTGTEFVEGIDLNLSKIDKYCFPTKAFKKMKTLRLFCLGNVELDGDYKYISRDLRWLCWRGFPLKCIPANFYQESLVSIELKYSSLRQVWREPQLLERLKILNCSHSPFLMQTPDFTKLPNLEKLILKNCPKLSMVHPTIGHANKLLLLNLKDCTGLCTLPRSLYTLKSLKTLVLSGCKRIEILEEDIEKMDSLTTLIADGTGITQAPLSLVRLKSVGYISLCGFRGLPRDVFPYLIWSRMSPTNNPLSLIPTYMGMPISSDILNRNVLVPSSICNNLAKLQSLLLEIASENDPEVIRGAAKFWESFHARICTDMATIPNTCVLSSHHCQVHSSSSENCLRHILIQIGKYDQGTAALLENISQGLTQGNYGDVCVLPGDNYPYWQSFEGEGASVKFKVPGVSDYDLKGMIIYCACAYFPSDDLGNKAFESCIRIMIVNYTKAKTLHYRQDSLTSLEEAEWKEIISNLGSDDQVEVFVDFVNGFTVKRTIVYLKYYDLSDEQIDHPPPPPNIVSFLKLSDKDPTYSKKGKRARYN